jgi:hypothetical protein
MFSVDGGNLFNQYKVYDVRLVSPCSSESAYNPSS